MQRFDVTDRFSTLILDSHWASASGLSAVIHRTLPGASVTVCRSMAEVEAWSRQNTFKRLLILADFWFGEGTALAVMDRFGENRTNVTMIVLSGEDHPLLRAKLSAAGVWGFLPKTAPPEQFMKLLHLALTDSPSPLVETSKSTPDSASGRRKSVLKLNADELGLTSRQFDILFHVLSARANKVIARQLGIAEQTVKEHVSRILAHFQVSNRLELIQHFAHQDMTLENPAHMRGTSSPAKSSRPIDDYRPDASGQMSCPPRSP